MGDLVCLDIALQEAGLRPGDVDLLIERRSAAWARHRGHRHAAYDDGMGRIVRALAGSYRLVIDTEQRFGLSGAFARALMAPGGSLAGFSTSRAARRTDLRVPYDPDQEHETVAFSRLLAAALGTPALDAPPVRPRRRPPTGPPLVGIAGLQSPSRRLTQARWAELVDRWARGRRVEISAAPADREFALGLADSVSVPATVIDGDFADVCSVVAAAEEVLSMDGGLVHVASYAGTPTTALFTSGRSGKWAPLAAGSRIVRRHGLDCQPCTLFGQTPPCPHGHACHALEITPAGVGA